MPTSDRVVVRLEHGSTEPGPTRTLTLYDDGSLVDDESWPPTVRALTPAGRDLVVGRVRDTGSFTKSHTIPAIPVEHGFGFFGVTLVVGTPITVGFSNVTCGTEGSPVGCKDDPEHGVLLALVDALSDVASWLPASAFRDGDLRPHPYLAAKTRVTSERILLRPDDWTNPEQSLGLIDWPLEILPSELGRPVQLADQPERTLRCELIDGARERTLRAALARLSSQTTEADPRTTIWDVWMDGPALIRLTLRPYLPDEVGGCHDTGLPAAPSLGGAPRPTLAAVLAASDGGIAPPQPTAILYARVSSTADEGAGRSVSYYADGTVLFRDPSPPAIGMGALWLTPAGLDLLRRTLDDSGLLASDYDESIPEGAVYAHMTTILTPDVVLNASDRGRVAKATAIAKLAAKLIDPASWLPATAWMTAPTRLLPFRPATLQLRIEPTTVPTDRVLPPVTALDSSLQSIGRADPDMPGARLATVSTGDAIAFITALEATGAPRSGGPTSVEYLLAANVPGGALKINLWVDINELSR